MTDQISPDVIVPSFREMVQQMSSTEQDRLFRVLNELQRKGSAERIQSLKNKLSSIKKQLSAIEADRNQKKAWMSDLSAVRARFGQALSTDSAPTAQQFAYVLHSLYTEAEKDVAKSKPSELLERKAELKQRIVALEQLAKIASTIGAEVKGGN